MEQWLVEFFGQYHPVTQALIATLFTWFVTAERLEKVFGHPPPWRTALWTRKGLAWLAGLELPTRAAAVQRDLLLDDLQRAAERIKRVERELQTMAQLNPGVALLRTIPGVGPRTAEAVVAYIDDARRFPRRTRGFAATGRGKGTRKGDHANVSRITRLYPKARLGGDVCDWDCGAGRYEPGPGPRHGSTQGNRGRARAETRSLFTATGSVRDH